MSIRKYVHQVKPIQENHIEPIDKIQNYLNHLNEADTKAAFDMEKVIVSAAGGPKFTSKLIKNSDKVGERIAKKLKLKGLGGKMPKNIYQASAQWNKYFAPGKAKGSTLTPKTDIIVGKKRISVKTGDAVLMSGEAKEATATFYTAIDNTNRWIHISGNANFEGTVDNVSVREALTVVDDSTYNPYYDIYDEETNPSGYWGNTNFYPDFDESCVGLIFISDSSNTTLKRDCLIELNMGDVEDTDSIVDTSGNSNIGLLIGDYTIKKESTLVPLTRDSEMKLPETDNEDKAI